MIQDGTTLVIAPHPDDEVLGVGGTIARLATQGAKVIVAIVTKATEDVLPKELIAKGREEAAMASRHLGAELEFVSDLPAANLDTVPHMKLNAVMAELIERIQPVNLFVPFVGDIHLDHQLIFNSCLVACRPNGRFIPPAWIYAYETLSETNWNAPLMTPAFIPNIYVEITETLDKKLEAMNLYSSQVKVYPHERSIEALRALAIHRGTTVNLRAAEAFMLIRGTVSL